ncbi:MAG: GTP 3',8-cyclase MoaA [Planctomycetota bacterium]
MKDSFNREINYLRISVTDRCNFRCQYCLPSEGVALLPREQILSYEEILEVARAAVEVGINKFRITGGEPLVRPGVVGFLERLINLTGVKRVSLTTNGYLLGEYAEELSRLNLGSINIGLNTLQEARFKQITGVSNNRLVLKGIKKLVEYGFERVKINTVLLKNVNEDEILDFARLTGKYPVSVRFIEFMPCGKWSENMDKVLMGDEIISVIEKGLGRLNPESGVPGDGPARYFKLPDAQGTLGFIMPVTNPFCNRCNRLRLTSDGLIKSCLLSTERVNIKPWVSDPSVNSGAEPAEAHQKLVEMLKNIITKKPYAHEGCRDIQMSKIGG